MTATTALIISAVIAAASTTATLYAQDTQSKQAQANMKFQADQAAADAASEASAAQVEAQRIRKQGQMQRAQTTAQAAAAGIDVNSPTAVKLDETVAKNSEEDALLTIAGGGDRAARLGQQSQVYRTGASIEASNNGMRQTATLINAGAAAFNSYSGWKRAT